MSSARPSRIFLTGFSGTGKSTVGPLVARRLGWSFVDTDAVVEAGAGRSIPDIFVQDGESRFRELEANALGRVCREEKIVVSVGGGAVLLRDNRRLMAESGFIVCLEARPETILRRLTSGPTEERIVRPLLARSGDPLDAIRQLKAMRQPLYALSDCTVHTDHLSSEEVAEEVIRAWQRLSIAAVSGEDRLEAIAGRPATADPDTWAGASCVVRASSGHYPVFVEWEGLSGLGRRLREAGLTTHVYIISDEHVLQRYGPQVEAVLRQEGITFASYAVPAGEASKSLEMAAAIYDWLVTLKAERGHAVIGLGGGMVTDLAGYVAATFARGLPLVHAPTSLLGMVDAAIGGKVAVNHPQAKNLIGAFYQPRLVLADVATLRTLPSRELASGWAEAIKHAFIADPELLAFLTDNSHRIRRLDPAATTEAIRRSVAVKAEVVSKDEREETGLRMTLNFGHTLAHALEAVTHYGQFLHGEAVAVGMVAAAAISVRMGLLDPEIEQRLRHTLQDFGLPVKASGVDRGLLASAMTLDKKVQGKTVRWVLLEGIGKTTIRNDVPDEVMQAALDEALES